MRAAGWCAHRPLAFQLPCTAYMTYSLHAKFRRALAVDLTDAFLWFLKSKPSRVKTLNEARRAGCATLYGRRARMRGRDKNLLALWGEEPKHGQQEASTEQNVSDWGDYADTKVAAAVRIPVWSNMHH